MKIQIQSIFLYLLAITFLATPSYGFQDLKIEGKVVADQRVQIKNPAKEDLVIVRIVNDGERVRKGDLLVEFDSARLQERNSMGKVNLNVAKAQLIQAENDLATAKIRMASSRKKFESELALLDSELETLFSKNGKFAVEEETLESTIVVENARTTFLKKKMEMYEEENQKDNVAYLELKFKLADSQAKSRVAMKSLAFLTEVSRKQERLKIAIQKDNIKLQMTESTQAAEAELATVQSKVEAQKKALELELETLKHLQAEIKNCQVYAPQDGVVYYVKYDQSRTGFAVEEGAVVRSNQPIAYLPNLNSLCAEVLVQESKIKNVKKGQKAVLVADANDLKLTGVVKSISSYPDSAAWVKSGKKYYKVLVSIKNPKKIQIGQSVVVDFAQ